MSLPPDLRQRLARTRLLPGDAVASGGIGERRSRARGEGIEFEDHRPYQYGDDFRRLDPHLYARLGQPYVRQYNVTQQLPVTIVIDASRSMEAGRPSKLGMARTIAAGLSYVALAGSDSVQNAIISGDRVHWHRRQSAASRLPELESWLSSWPAKGGSDLASAAAIVRERLQVHGLVIMISDFWSDTAADAIKTLLAAEQSLVAIHLLSPEEVEPERYGSGSMRLTDIETNEEVDVSIGPAEAARYGRLLAEWTDGLRERVHDGRGRFLQVRSDEDPEALFTRTFPTAGILR